MEAKVIGIAAVWGDALGGFSGRRVPLWRSHFLTTISTNLIPTGEVKWKVDKFICSCFIMWYLKFEFEK